MLPPYNVQVAVCDECIAVFNVKHCALATEYFVPLMEKFNNFYEYYPKYPVSDADYGLYSNCIYLKNIT